MTNINQYAKKFIEGEWCYSTSEKTLKKTFATDKELTALNLIDDAGYLDEDLKTAIIEALGETVLAETKGPFGDADIFSGDIFDDETHYNIELHNISELTMDAVQHLSGATIKIIE